MSSVRREETRGHSVRVVYVAGPFRAPTAWEIAENIREAERIGLQIARLGAMPLIPHANTAHFHGSLPDEFWLKGTMELMRRCDAIMMLDGWRKSEGSVAEREEMVRLGKPVFHWASDLLLPDGDKDFHHGFLPWLEETNASL